MNKYLRDRQAFQEGREPINGIKKYTVEVSSIIHHNIMHKWICRTPPLYHLLNPIPPLNNLNIPDGQKDAEMVTILQYLLLTNVHLNITPALPPWLFHGCSMGSSSDIDLVGAGAPAATVSNTSLFVTPKIPTIFFPKKQGNPLSL